ncbi:hexose transporter HXT13 [Mollisia scopiformis]|uniref:Hexose transporter HXT13 n=1 Tax=Mollisia scopiformis TaxID=149040 RepID=A0A132B383_MOLSC|nr:hexose transporter HXT13 [Mollisia scopiformis]KUJ06374.1 hexose transporter HXT13 [Mollisia scopiformis]
MGFFTRKSRGTTDIAEKHSPQSTTPEGLTPAASIHGPDDIQPAAVEDALKEQPVTWLALVLGGVASIGGFMFGYESGQISGFLAMSDFLDRFGQNGKFSAARQGTIVGLLCIGTLFGCLFSGWLADKIGRKKTICFSAFFYIIGVVIEITSQRQWVQFAMGRFTAGLGIGALSTSVPMYQSESVPKNIRGAMVSSYQLLITLGIWTAYMVNYGTEAAYSNSAQWRIPNGLSALWALILAISMIRLPESPRYAYRVGRKEEARKTMARLNGVSIDSPLIEHEINEIEEKIQAENVDGGRHSIWEIFTGPRMLYRTLLGMTLQAGQQLTGANFFFYYGTTIFQSTGISNSYITSIILGSVNVGATIVGLWIVKNCGRRKALMYGAAWMFGCLLIYAFVGRFSLSLDDPLSTPTAGKVLIVFTCLFIVAFATTWGPLVWAVVGELYPARYRAPCMALATASNWLFNFLISFFTTFITNKIHYLYGLVFAVSCGALFFIVYFFMIETKDRSLEEIDTMYMLRVPPRKSASWSPHGLGPDGMAGINTDTLFLKNGGKDIKKTEANGQGMMVHDERNYPENPLLKEATGAGVTPIPAAANAAS